MDPDSCTPLVFHQLYILILVILFLLITVLTMTLAAMRVIKERNIPYSPEEDSSPDEKSSVSVKLLDDTTSSQTIWIALLCFSSIFSTLAVIFIKDSFCMSDNPGIFLLLATGTVLLLLFGETLLSGLVSKSPLRWLNVFDGIAFGVSVIFTPIFNLSQAIRINPVEVVPENPEQVESNLRDWVENIPDNTLLEQGERKMIRSIVHFSNTLIREIMIPRVDMTALDVDGDLHEAAKVVLASGHSRLPVYDDEIDNIIGVLYAKDLLQVFLEKREITVRELLRPPLFVPEAKKAGELLTEMQASGVHMVIVVDEYGGTSGIVSMEDIVEEIVGEIRDEYDESEETLVRVLGSDEYSFLGRIDLEDVNEYLGTHLTRDSADTLAGYLVSKIGKVPTGDEIVEEEGWLFSIEELTDRRIRRVLVTKQVEKEDKDKDEHIDGSETKKEEKVNDEGKKE